MRNVLLALSLFCAIALATPVHAQRGALDEIDARFEEQLKAFDPRAVNAARSYSKSFDTRGQLEAMSSSMRPGLIQLVKSKNPDIKDAELEVFFQEFFKVALVDSAPILEKWTMLNMLEILSTDELVAADQFFSSALGKSMMSKMPQMMARMPQMMGLMQQTFIPAGLAAAQAKLKGMGRDLKI